MMEPKLSALAVYVTTLGGGGGYSTPAAGGGLGGEGLGGGLGGVGGGLSGGLGGGGVFAAAVTEVGVVGQTYVFTLPQMVVLTVQFVVDAPHPLKGEFTQSVAFAKHAYPAFVIVSPG